MSKMIKYRQLGKTGMNLSILGMGGSGFGNVYGKYSEEEGIKAVHYAVSKGINYFDTAYWYGQGTSETFLGKAFKGIARDKFYIGTKVGRYERPLADMFDFSASKVMQSAEESLERLQLSYVDLLQVHDVEFAPSIDMVVNETLPALEELRNRGLCRFVGITGYVLPDLLDVIAKSQVNIDSVLSYCRLTLNDSTLLDHVEAFQDVPIINASPVSMGLLLNEGEIQDWHPATDDIRKACAEAVKYCSDQGVDITRIAVNYSANFEQVTTTLISMNDCATIDKNIDAVMRPLTPKEEQVKQHIQRTFFAPLEQPHWEGIEVKQYWSEVGTH